MDRNFLGGGRTLELSARSARIGAGAPLDFGLRSSNFCGGQRGQVGDTVLTYRLAADFQQPRLLGTRTRFSLNAYAERQAEVSLFVRQSVGSQLSVSRDFGGGFGSGVGLQVERGSTQASYAIFCVIFAACTEEEQIPLRERRWSNAATLTSSFDRVRGGTELRLNGYRLRSSVAWAAPLLYSTDEYLNVFGEAVGFWTMRPGWVVAARVQGGSFLSGAGPSGYIPPERRFYAGGPTTVRGFPPNSLGPLAYITTAECGSSACSDINPQRYPLGGTRTVVGTVELRTPSPFMPQYLRWAAFVDAGQVWAPGLRNPDTDQDFGAATVQVTPGVGMRIATPVGPIRVDVGYNPGLRAGPLYYARVDEKGRPLGTLELLRANYTPPQQGLLSHLEFHLAVGQAF
jgi:outer membrane protein assembly factor BamA